MNSHSPLILPDKYEVMITKIQDTDLQSIGDRLGVHRLSIANREDAVLPVYGIMRGISVRMFIPLVVSHKEASLHVIFLMDTGSPNTYLRVDTFEKLGFRENIISDANVDVQGTTLTVYPWHSHFENVDLLGQDFMALHNVRMISDYKRKTIFLEDA